MVIASPTTRFILWREVLFAYLAPAICAGVGGLATDRPDLMLAAATSIAGTSAAVALIIGIWLQHRGFRYGRLRSSSPALLAAAFGAATAAVAVSLTQLLAAVPALPDRIRVDGPIAASIAAVIITLRWCSTLRKEER
ncbi:hypothetical protein AB0I30_35685 [Nocardia tengchongensis]|uniref:hypothetical protein n=1 Tax=Nocardia tengchongensis TaxID=2055889 RepID=UPI0033CE13A0